VDGLEAFMIRQLSMYILLLLNEENYEERIEREKYPNLRPLNFHLLVKEDIQKFIMLSSFPAN
jgi:hypothetical protein